MTGDHTANSHYLTFTILLWTDDDAKLNRSWENVVFELGSDRVHLPEAF